MVFHLIEEGMFGKQDSDTREDFSNAFSFHEAFSMPFLPVSALAPATAEETPGVSTQG